MSALKTFSAVRCNWQGGASGAVQALRVCTMLQEVAVAKCTAAGAWPELATLPQLRRLYVDSKHASPTVLAIEEPGEADLELECQRSTREAQ